MSKTTPLRRENLLSILRREELDAMLVTGESNVKYLTGFTGDSSYLLIGAGVCVVISDSRYTTQLAEECPGLDVFIRKTSEKISDSVAKVAKKAKIGRLGFEGHLMSCDLRDALGTALDKVEFRSIGGKIESELRAIKDGDEVAETIEAVRLAERGFEVMRASITPESTELALSWELERAIRMFGGKGMAFAPIVGVGDRAALPHYSPQRYAVQQSPLLLVDWGAQTYRGYRSDITRTLMTGTPTKKMEEVYNVVLEAQLKAIAAIKPGAKCADIDTIAREHIAQAGYAKYFGHGLGHGIGLDIHEQPRFSPNSIDVLQPGMIVTVEPGIYLPNKFGVRIEDDVLVTSNGHEVLTTIPKDFESMLCGA
ncbi:MAG: Xaa-Pro peptidase family protein [Planctomycetaceae bacterium]